MKLFIFIIAVVLISACSHKHYKKKWTEMDIDKDGKVSKSEYLKAKGDRFTKMDLDKDGFVTIEEKKQYYKQKK